MKTKIYIILMIELILISCFTVYNLSTSFRSIKYSTVNKIVIVAFFLLLIILLMGFIFSKFSGKKVQIALLAILFTGFNLGIYVANDFLFTLKSAFSNINQSTKYSSSLIVKKDSKYKKEDDIDKKTKIGIQSVSNYEDGAMINTELKKLNKTKQIKQFKKHKDAFISLQKGKIDMMSVKDLTNKSLLKIDPDLLKNYRILTTFTAEENDEKVTKDITTTPFTILILGIDSREKNINSGNAANGDSSILVTFDPKSGQVTTLTTPRDSYIQLACTAPGAKSKLTHAASLGGEKCMKKTLENLYDVKVDYYVKINFIGVVDIVNTLGGINIDAPVNYNPDVGVDSSIKNRKVCEQSSKGKKHGLTQCWYEGKVNKMNGETALAFARNRYQQDNGDLDRGRNQQLVIESILKRATSINNPDTINKLISVVSKHMKTNLQQDDILSLYDIMVGLDHGINFEKLYIGADSYGKDESGQDIVNPSLGDIEYADYRMKVITKKVFPQFPEKKYNISATQPDNPLKKEKMPFNSKPKKRVLE